MNLDSLMSATRFAVVGASADPDKVGHQILRNLHSNPSLSVYPINLKGGTILGLPVSAHLWETPEPAEVVIIVIPALAVEPVIDECIKIGAKAVVLITAGFAEAGESGKVLQTRILAKLHAANISLLGPNTMGYIAPWKKIYASFGPSDLGPGSVALISQSGAMLSALFQEYTSAKIGVSFAVSLGNATGLSQNDALTHALTDEETKIVAVYLESVADPKTLLTIAKKLSSKKPIFLLKGGTTEQGRSAALSHTAALATSQVLLDDLCLQAGIVQVDNFEQLVRATIATGKTTFLPENLMIMTNAGGPAVVLTDEITEAGIPLAVLSDSTRAALSSRLPKLKLSNPLDLLGDASPEAYGEALTVLSGDLTIDTLVIVVTEQAVTNMPELTEVLLHHPSKHLLFACLAGGDSLEFYRQKLRDSGVIVTKYPNEIADTLGSLLKAKKQLGKKLELEVWEGTTQNSYPKTFEELTKLLEDYGIRSPAEVIISTEGELDKIKDLGWPVIGKTTSLDLHHKAKIGAVIQDILNVDDAKIALGKLKQWNDKVIFQQKVRSGVEVLMGAHNDVSWGWYMAVGMGGSLSDTYDDRAYVFLPATKLEMQQAVSRTKLTKLLNPLSSAKLVDAMHSLQECVLSTSGLTEIEINPLFVTDREVVAADLKRV